MTNVTLLTYKATKLMNDTTVVRHCYVPKPGLIHYILESKTILIYSISYFTFSKPQLKLNFLTVPSRKHSTSTTNHTI